MPRRKDAKMIRIGRNNKKPAETPKAEPKVTPGRFIAWFRIGGGGKPENRYMGYGIPERGWAAFKAESLDRCEKILAPEDGVGLHNLFGLEHRGDMQPDQFILAQETGNQRLTVGAADVLRESSRRRETIAYVGNLPRDPDFAERKREPFLWLERALESYGPMLLARCSIGFDVLCDLSSDDPAVKFVEMLESLGTRCYGEPLPHADDRWAIGRSVILEEEFWRSQCANGWPAWAMSREQLGEIIRVADNNLAKANGGWEKSREWLPKWIVQCWREGCTPACGPELFFELGQTVRQATEKYL